MLLLAILTLTTILDLVGANQPSVPGDPQDLDEVVLVGKNLTWAPSTDAHEYGVFVYKNGGWEEVERVNEPMVTVWDHQLKYNQKEQRGTFPVKIVAKNTISGKTAQSSVHFNYYWPSDAYKGCSFLPQTDDLVIQYELNDNRVSIDESAEQISQLAYGTIARMESGGYKLRRTCNQSAIWTEMQVDEIPCLAKCGVLTASPSTKVEYSPDVVAGNLAPSGTKATIVCSTGFSDDNLSHKIVTCANGQWKPDPAHCVSTCKQRLEAILPVTAPEMKAQLTAVLNNLDTTKQCRLADLAQLLGSKFDASVYGPYLQRLLQKSEGIGQMLQALDGMTDKQIIDYITKQLFSNQLTTAAPTGQCVDVGRNCAVEAVCSAVAESYQGTKSTTVTGLSCRSWEEDAAKYKNYCRNPYEGDLAPWCYVENQNVNWQYCFQFCPSDTSDCLQRIRVVASGSGLGLEYLDVIPDITNSLTPTEKCKTAELAEMLQGRLDSSQLEKAFIDIIQGNIALADLIATRESNGDDAVMSIILPSDSNTTPQSTNQCAKKSLGAGRHDYTEETAAGAILNGGTLSVTCHEQPIARLQCQNGAWIDICVEETCWTYVQSSGALFKLFKHFGSKSDRDPLLPHFVDSCQLNCGVLASVHSQQEDDAIQSTDGSPVIFGLYELHNRQKPKDIDYEYGSKRSVTVPASAMNFHNIDGSSVDYTDWKSMGPSCNEYPSTVPSLSGCTAVKYNQDWLLLAAFGPAYYNGFNDDDAANKATYQDSSYACRNDLVEWKNAEPPERPGVPSVVSVTKAVYQVKTPFGREVRIDDKTFAVAALVTWRGSAFATKYIFQLIAFGEIEAIAETTDTWLNVTNEMLPVDSYGLFYCRIIAVNAHGFSEPSHFGYLYLGAPQCIHNIYKDYKTCYFPNILHTNVTYTNTDHRCASILPNPALRQRNNNGCLKDGYVATVVADGVSSDFTFVQGNKPWLIDTYTESEFELHPPTPVKGAWHVTEPLWSKIESHWYMVVTEEKTAVDASKICHSFGARLASVHSVSEQNALHDLFRDKAGAVSSYWLNGVKESGSSSFSYDDFSNMNFTAWHDDKFNLNEERCIATCDSSCPGNMWRPITCDQKLPFVCKRENMDVDKCEPSMCNIHEITNENLFVGYVFYNSSDRNDLG